MKMALRASARRCEGRIESDTCRDHLNRSKCCGRLARERMRLRAKGVSTIIHVTMSLEEEPLKEASGDIISTLKQLKDSTPGDLKDDPDGNAGNSGTMFGHADGEPEMTCH